MGGGRSAHFSNLRAETPVDACGGRVRLEKIGRGTKTEGAKLMKKIALYPNRGFVLKKAGLPSGWLLLKKLALLWLVTHAALASSRAADLVWDSTTSIADGLVDGAGNWSTSGSGNNHWW